MEIRFNAKQIEALPIFNQPPFRTRTTYRSRGIQSYELLNYSKEHLLALRACIVENLNKFPGLKRTVAEIDSWLQMAEGFAKDTKIKNAKMLLTHLTSKLLKSPRQWLYVRQNLGEGRDYYFAYYISNIAYVPPSKWNSEHVQITMNYTERGRGHSTNRSIYAQNVSLEKTLYNHGLYFETPPILDDYEFFLEEYGSLVSNIGTQCLAEGIGSDDDVDDVLSGSHYRWQSNQFNLCHEGQKSLVVVDIDDETDRTKRSKELPSTEFWLNRKKSLGLVKVRNDEDVVEDDGGEEIEVVETEEGETEVNQDLIADIPVHPIVTIFHLKKHMRLKTHVVNLTRFSYPDTRNQLVLPEVHRKVLDVLLKNRGYKFNDVVANKQGGVLILCQGPPGTGKTLTAEVYASDLKLPLYTVQCSQLGLSVDALEKNLGVCLDRANRWGSVMLLDEADVYIHERGDDLHQNAIVGVFLRLLEYYPGVLFLTTNRGDIVDDAILSRCTVRVQYDVPTVESQKQIWRNLLEVNGITADVDEIVSLNSDLSGRDIKNLLKLAIMLNEGVTGSVIQTLRTFKPTAFASKGR